MSDVREILRELRVELRPRDAMPGAPDGTEILREEGQLRLILPEGQVLSCAEDRPGGEDILRLAAELVRTTELADEGTRLWRAILDGRADETGMPSDSLPRCVLLCEGRPGLEQELAELAPLEEQDALVPLRPGTAALLKDLSGIARETEIVQFAQALLETVLSETGSAIRIGIGGRCASLKELPRGLREAQEALRLGRILRPEENVLLYAHLTLERLVASVPEEAARETASQLFNRRNSRLLDEEMLRTIDAFFRKSLNVSDTARQLFIHRNTLLYRLDKVQKQTGLDLRCFDDAVTFRLLLALRQYRGEPDRPDGAERSE